MFYFVSKIVWFFLTPSNALVTLVLAGLLLMRTKRAVLGGRLAAAGGVGLLVAGLSPLGNALILPLEERFPAYRDDGVSVAGFIVLGGTFDTEVTNERGQMALNETGERIVALGDLARRLSGSADHLCRRRQRIHARHNAGSDAGREHHRGSSASLRRALIDDRRSLNTFQNALYAKRSRGRRRASAGSSSRRRFICRARWVCFARRDLPSCPILSIIAPRVTPRWCGRLHLSAKGLRRTDIAAKEWIGLVRLSH